ncbi:16 kDa beta-galactoside-binding lectin-like isoform X2 [Hemicordylus capensis]|uniref:16 kDa beta-galactoside-binding lectin-like isoform X2 n=1 Tax=Hemicordylus capensis TaxID=884348 RepID=UPI0023038624|nr:16 kDa beta-galactoside-binding lectin-like isoform X2 [Hemicordylus capensis]
MECVMTATGLKIQPGEGLEVKGKILPDAKDFAVNLGKDCDNLVLHFNPRFDNHGDVNTIVCNSKQDGAWGEEERDASFPFQQGEKAQVLSACSPQPGQQLHLLTQGRAASQLLSRPLGMLEQWCLHSLPLACCSP